MSVDSAYTSWLVSKPRRRRDRLGETLVPELVRDTDGKEEEGEGGREGIELRAGGRGGGEGVGGEEAPRIEDPLERKDGGLFGKAGGRAEDFNVAEGEKEIYDPDTGGGAVPSLGGASPDLAGKGGSVAYD